MDTVIEQEPFTEHGKEDSKFVVSLEDARAASIQGIPGVYWTEETMNEAIGLQLQQVERKYKLNTPVNKGKLHVNTEPYSFSKIPDFPGNLIGLYILISFSFKKKFAVFCNCICLILGFF